MGITLLQAFLKDKLFPIFKNETNAVQMLLIGMYFTGAKSIQI